MNFLSLGAGLAALGVILGAFGAHGLKNVLDAPMLQIFETGVRYQMYSAFGLIAVGLVRTESPLLSWSGWLLLAGTVVFSGSLYGLTLTGLRKLGMITPLGGLMMIAGWILLAVAARAR
ncbi:MAG: DUF423 domain-containing protein [Armatimonadetes bacterium]|nr:DUF423 domain-containing protein [Armatimonadota bacterium]